MRAIVGLSQQLNLKVLAEGVETSEQLGALRSIHCDEYQGYYFSDPVPALRFEQILRDQAELQSGAYIMSRRAPA